jgi:hypothetical protein
VTSPLPPRRRDTRDSADLLRQLKQNARQLGVGFVGGRFPPAKPLGATAPLGALEDDTAYEVDTELQAAINTDSAVATESGIITLTLTYVPIDGTLLIFWGGRRVEPSDYVLVDQRVTITDRHIHAGDVISAAYWYWPADVDEPEPASPLTSLTLRGTSTTTTLPAATQIGDFLVIAAEGVLANSDPRLTQIGDRMFVGVATDLTPLGFSLTTTAAIAVAAFSESPVAIAASIQVTTSSNSQVLPTLPGNAAVSAITDWHSVSPGTGSLPAPWVLAVDSGGGLGHAAVYYWFDSAAADTPASVASYNGGPGTRYAVVATLEA